MKKCNKCNRNLSLSKFSKWSRSKDGYKSTCKKCISKKYREDKISKGLKVRIDRTSETDTTKICTKCLELVDNSKFSGSSSWCNKCRTADNRKRLGNLEKPVPIVLDDKKQCLRCKELKSFNEFYKSKRGREGLASYCKDCIPASPKTKEYTKAYRLRHRERYLASHRLHQFKRRSSMIITSDDSINDKFLKELYSTEICHYCGNIVNISNRTLEHKTPLIRGGHHSKDNCVMACLKCNCSKGSKTEKEFLKLLNDDKKED